MDLIPITISRKPLRDAAVLACEAKRGTGNCTRDEIEYVYMWEVVQTFIHEVCHHKEKRDDEDYSWNTDPIQVCTLNSHLSIFGDEPVGWKVLNEPQSIRTEPGSSSNDAITQFNNQFTSIQSTPGDINHVIAGFDYLDTLPEGTAIEWHYETP